MKLNNNDIGDKPINILLLPMKYITIINSRVFVHC